MPRTDFSPVLARFGACALLLLAACDAPEGPRTDLGIGVGALPGRPGYEHVVLGVQLAVARLNADAVDGARFRVVLPGDSARSAVAIASALRADPAVIGVVGHPESGTTQAAVPVYAALGEDAGDAVAVVSPTATSPALSGISPWFFRVAPSDAASARDVARYAWDSLRVGIAAVVYRNDAYGRDWTTAFAAAWLSRGGTLPVRAPYLPGQTAWATYAAHIAAEDPDVVLFPGDATDAAELLRALRAAGARAAFIGADGTEALAGQPEFAGVRIARIYQPDADTTAEARRFRDAWHTRRPGPPDMFAALAYDAALAIGTAWRASAVRSRAGLRDALERLAIDGAGGRIAFDRATHDVLGRGVSISVVAPAPRGGVP
jgi:branched-chain amino acid transport system substrate-binding protein